MAEFYYDDGTPVAPEEHQFNMNPDNFQDWPFEEDIIQEIQDGTFVDKFVEVTDKGKEVE